MTREMSLGGCNISIKTVFFDAVYPKRCPICGDIVKQKGTLVCPECYHKAPLIKEPSCKKCGKSIGNMETEFCYDCNRREHFYEQGFSLWNYDDVMRKSIANFKYHHRKEYVQFYAEEFARTFGKTIMRLRPDAFVPVPVHWTRHVERGYNQAQVLAEAIGLCLDIPVIEDLLVRKKRTAAQKSLDHRERSRNLHHAFSISERWESSVGKLKRLVIIDDIFTTGSTVNSCAKVLKKAGVSEVYFGVLCNGIGY